MYGHLRAQALANAQLPASAQISGASGANRAAEVARAPTQEMPQNVPRLIHGPGGSPREQEEGL